MLDNDQKIIFEFPKGNDSIEVIEEILKNNNLPEDNEEYFKKFSKGIESRTIILRDSTLTLFEKKIPEEKLIEILASHLKTSKETAQKIVADIKQKLLPYAKKITLPTEEEVKRETEPVEENLSVQEALIEKLRQSIPNDENTEHRIQNTELNKNAPQVKKVEVEDVEKNAEELKRQREETAKPGTTGGNINKGQTDPYREATG